MACSDSVVKVQEVINTVEIECEKSIVVVEEEITILSTGTQGPEGLQGQSGEAETINASIALGGGRAVEVGGVYADPSTEDSISRYIGVTQNAVSAGQDVNIKKSGSMTDLSWSWTVDEPIYIGANGVLTQTPTAQNIRRIAWAVSATTINLDEFPIIKLN